MVSDFPMKNLVEKLKFIFKGKKLTDEKPLKDQLSCSTCRFCLSELYGNHRLIEFEDTAELVDKVAYFSHKDEERRAIAERGHEFVHREFNGRIVAQYLIEALFDETFSRRYAWPSRCYSAISQTALDSAAVP